MYPNVYIYIICIDIPIDGMPVVCDRIMGCCIKHNIGKCSKLWCTIINACFVWPGNGAMHTSSTVAIWLRYVHDPCCCCLTLYILQDFQRVKLFLAFLTDFDLNSHPAQNFAGWSLDQSVI